MRHALEGDVRSWLRLDGPLRRFLSIRYQLEMLKSLAAVWLPSCKRVLDIGCGESHFTLALRRTLPLEYVAGIDVASRFAAGVPVDRARFDGKHVPFANGSFDAVTLVNVLHHVPPQLRASLLAECARVTGSGPIFVKDHVVQARADRARLIVLDMIGNVPVGGMVSATYMRAEDILELAASVGYSETASVGGKYRSGVFAWIFPNRLERVVRLEARIPDAMRSCERSK